MSDRNNDFLSGLKVQVEDKPKLERPELFSEMDIYTCLSLMKDTARVQNFLRIAREESPANQRISVSMATNYYNSINQQLGNVEFDFRKGKITETEFNSKISNVCKEHNLDFNNLLSLTDRIETLEREPNEEESIKLAQEIEARVIEEREKRLGKEKE